jgi:hypothetical protein
MKNNPYDVPKCDISGRGRGQGAPRHDKPWMAVLIPCIPVIGLSSLEVAMLFVMSHLPATILDFCLSPLVECFTSRTLLAGWLTTSCFVGLILAVTRDRTGLVFRMLDVLLSILLIHIFCFVVAYFSAATIITVPIRMQ